MDKNHDMYMKLKNEHSRLKKELQQEQGKNKRLQGEISKLKEELKDVKPGKSSQRVKELREHLAEQERVNIVLRDTIYTLEQEKKQIGFAIELRPRVLTKSGPPSGRATTVRLRQMQEKRCGQETEGGAVRGTAT